MSKKLKIISVDLETTLGTFQELRVITVKADNQDKPSILYEYAKDGSKVSTEVINYINSFDLIITHNGFNLDIPILNKHGIKTKYYWDTYLAEVLLSGGLKLKPPSYKELVSKYFNISLSKEEQTSDWSKELTDSQREYCYKDVQYLQGIYEKQLEFSKKSGALPHILLKNKILGSITPDLFLGYPIDRSIKDSIYRECMNLYYNNFSKLMDKLPVKFFLKSNYSLKDLNSLLEEAKPYNSKIKLLSEYTKEDGLAKKKFGKSDINLIDFEELRGYFLENPYSNILVNISTSHFAKNVFKYFNVNVKSTDSDSIKDYIDDGSNEELKEILSIILDIRMVSKLAGTYCKEDPKIYAEDSNGQLLVRSRIESTNSGRLTIKPFNNCLPLDTTEVLSSEGWKRLEDIKKGDTILTSTSNRELVFDTVLDVVEPRIEKVYKKGFIEATEKHRVVRLSYPNDKMIIEEMKDIKPNARIPVSGNLLGGKQEDNLVLKLAGLLLADGYYHGNQWVLKFKHPRKVKFVNENKSLFNWVRLRDNGYTEATIKKDIGMYCTSYIDAYKVVNIKELLKLNRNSLNSFFEGYLLGDGTGVYNKTGGVQYFTVSYSASQALQIIGTLLGYRVSVQEDRRSINNPNWQDGFNSYGSKRAFRILGIKDKKSNKYPKSFENLESRETLVSCVTVNTGIFLCRQNGNIFLTGNCPQPDDNKTELQNKVSEMFIPPKGYITLSADYSSIESYATGRLYNDKNKLYYLENKYDPYILLASKIFGFKYDDPSQTKDLKKKYKSLRQSVKAVELAKGYGAGKNKCYKMLELASKKLGIDLKVNADEVEQAWESLYPGIAKAQKEMSTRIAELVSRNLDKRNPIHCHSGYTMSFDPDKNKKAEQANKVRRDVLRKSHKTLSCSSMLGLKRFYNYHTSFNHISPKYKKTRITEQINYISQSSAGEILWLASYLIKKYFPSIRFGTLIHDSVVLFVPDKGIGDLSLEDIKENIINLMELTSEIILNYTVPVEANYTKFGWK